MVTVRSVLVTITIMATVPIVRAITAKAATVRNALDVYKRQERRTECIDGSQCSSGKFAFQLSGNSQAGLLSEKVIIVNNGTVLIFL